MNHTTTTQTKMQWTLRRAADRGHANHGWLDTWHSFSFADYYDPAHMGFRSLRVINDDRVAARGGFPTHPHRDMEIFSYIVEGTLEHRDSMGNGRQLQPGQIQLMSAGSGVTHSEFNPSPKDPVHLLQIWIHPEKRGLTPSYTEWHPSPESEQEAKVLVISKDGRHRSATIAQDADIFRVRLVKGATTEHEVAARRGVWFQLIKGSVQIDGTDLHPGDAFSSESAGRFEIIGLENAEGLLFDLG